MTTQRIALGRMGDKPARVIDYFFEGPYAFLDNFYVHPMTYRGLAMDTVEHGFQAMKALHTDEFLEILRAKDPGTAKALGRACKLRPDWDTKSAGGNSDLLVKDVVMWELVDHKFNHPGLAAQLLATDNAILVEGNTWHDRYWGRCDCPACGGKGKNMLGQLLMRKRKQLRER